jgi:ribosomal protein S18 acetylase RimI-like enzyme
MEKLVPKTRRRSRPYYLLLDNIRGNLSLLLPFLLLLSSLQTTFAFVQPTYHRSAFTSRVSSSLVITNGSKSTNEKISFIVEALPKQPNPEVFKEIAVMCIAAFFNDGNPGRQVAPWKELQLSYLRTLQENDLRRRRERQSDFNFMLVARRVVPAEMSKVRSNTPLILDFTDVFNLDNNNNRQQEEDFARGEILGFVEVTKKPYGLGSYDDNSIQNSREAEVKSPRSTERPFLTNLSVSYTARRSGVGSKLVELCEREVLRRWYKNEIILEVEGDNFNALGFYKKRGYKVLFENPTSRMYDLNGFFLQQKRCNRSVMRKTITSGIGSPVSGEVKSTIDKGLQALLRVFAGSRG